MNAPAPRRLAPLIPVQHRGLGLFTGRPSRLTITESARPGLWFQRTDLPGKPRCPATTASLSARPIHTAFAAMPPRSTNLETRAGDVIATVEHILAALDGMGITDALLELDSPEVPLMDAAALCFAETIEFAQPEEGEPLAVRTLPRTIEVRDPRDPTAVIVASPRSSPGRSYRYDLDYTTLTGPLAPEGAALGRQSATWDGTPASFLTDIAPARTFCLKAEADAMRAAGLLAHLTDQDALVIGPDGPINNAYRFPDEPARHKLLDLVGDLALIGCRVQMDVHATRTGHALNHRLAREIAAALE